MHTNDEAKTLAPASAADPLGGTISALVTYLRRVASSGDIAALRRLRVDNCLAPAFFRLAASHLAEALSVPGMPRDGLERRWAVVLWCMAELFERHRPGERLGRAMAAADVNELRLLRLLRSSGPALADAVRGVVRQLATRGVPVDLTDLARLILSDRRDDEEVVRRRIARDFYASTSPAQEPA